jgi:hypothetical protein
MNHPDDCYVEISNEELLPLDYYFSLSSKYDLISDKGLVLFYTNIRYKLFTDIVIKNYTVIVTNYF